MPKKISSKSFVLTFALVAGWVPNVDLNICAHTWHSVSIMGHNQDFELAGPELTLYNINQEPKTIFFLLF